MTNRIAHAVVRGHQFLFKKEYAFFQVWEKLSFPHRPTQNEVEIYRQFIGEADAETKFLILGPTPELRDLLSEFRSHPILVDTSWMMLAGMSRFLKKAKPDEEIWVKANWLDVPLPERFFDIVLADLSLRHVALGEQKTLLRKISNVLRPGGKFIVRHHVINPAYRGASCEAILGEAEKLPYEDRKYETMGVLLSRLFDASTNGGMNDHRAIVSAVRRYSAKRDTAFSYRLFLAEFMKKRLEVLTYPLASQTKEEIEKLFNEHFSIDGIRRGDSYPESAFYPIYRLIPRHGKKR